MKIISILSLFFMLNLVVMKKSYSEGNVDFATIQEKILDAKCIRCHSGAFAPLGLDYTTYESLIVNPPYQVIVKGDPANSILYNAVLSGRMPLGGPRLTQDELKIVYDWIKAGAPEFFQ